ncbi:MAG: hypothetical protein R6W90_13115 [Ignavibacteriaceae bacterium]
MKNHLLLLIIVFAGFFSSPVFSQNKLSLNIGSGYYLNNSENSLDIVGDKRYKFYLFYGFAYERENILGFDLMFEYNYHQMVKKDVLTFVYSGEASPDPSGFFSADVSLINHNFDFTCTGRISSYFLYGIGPSFVITNRTIEVDLPDNIGAVQSKMDFYDKLASSGIGLNGFLEFRIPLDNNPNYFFFTSKLKLRYTYSIWFDEGLRNLDDYYQEFLTMHLSAGVGYSF